MLRTNAPSEDVTNLLVALGLIVFMWICICYVRYKTDIDNANDNDELYNFAFSTSIEVNPHVFQMEVPRYRRPTSPKINNPV